MKLVENIFRAYDIRGIFSIDFDEDGFEILGKGVSQYFLKKFPGKILKIILTSDARISSSILLNSLNKGLQNDRIEIIYGGKVPTPLNLFAFYHDNFDISLQITASHNPKEYNGLKISDKIGSVCGEELQEISKICQKLSKEELSINQNFSQENLETDKYSSQIVTNYLQKLNTINLEKWDLILDTGNAIAGNFYPQIFKKLGAKVETIFQTIDGNFPNHQPDPEDPKNLKWLQDKIKKGQIGVAYDGDGDRLGVVLDDGTILNADKILYILARDLLSRNPKAKIIVDAMTSQQLIQKLTQYGAEVIISKTGHSFIEIAMHKNEALLGGEQSGHFMFAENWYGNDDACLATIRFLQAIENNPKLLEEVTIGWKSLYEFNHKFTTTEDNKFIIFDKIAEQLNKLWGEGITLDGWRKNFENNDWVIARVSNTSPKISVRLECADKQDLQKKKKQLEDIFASFL